MMDNNSKTNLLQQAVKPLDDTQRARVLEFALKCQIDPSDPFWVQYIILGELQVSEWRDLLIEFRDEMQLLAETNEQWSEVNLGLMDSLVKKAEIEATLSLSLSSLLTALSSLTTSSTELTQQLKTSREGSMDLSVQMRLSDQISELKLLSDRQADTLQRLSRKLEDSGDRSAWMRYGLVISGAIAVVFCWIAWVKLADTNQRVIWTLQKVECATSVKASKTAFCKKILK
jgi:hypothetical protein